MKKILSLLLFLVSTFSYGQQAHYFSGIPRSYVQDTIYFYGDSYTGGTGASQSSYRYTTQVADRLRMIESNQGAGGTTLENGVPLNPYGGGGLNMVQKLPTVPIYNSAVHGYISIFFGINDMGWNAGTYDTTHFGSDYRNVIDTIIRTRGWPRNRVIIVSPQYGSNATYTAYASTTGTTIIVRKRNQDFYTSAKLTASGAGCLFADVYTAFLKNQDSTLLLGGDNIHPIDAGHQLIAQVIYRTIQDSVLTNGQKLGINGNADFNSVYIRSPDTAGLSAQVAGIDSNGHVVVMKSNDWVKNGILYPQPVGISVSSKLLTGQSSLTPLTTLPVEDIVAVANTPTGASGGIQGTFVRAIGGGIPAGLLGSGMEMGKAAGLGYIGCYNRTSSTAVDMTMQALGGSIMVGALALSGSQKFQVTGGGYFSTTIGIGTNAPISVLNVAGNFSTADQGTKGSQATFEAATYTWSNITTPALRGSFSIQAPTLAAASPTTITDAFSLYVASPVAGASTTITNNNAIYAAGNVKIALASGLKIVEGTDGRTGQSALVSGTKAITINGITTSSRAFITLVSQSGTTTTTQSYIAVCTANTLTVSAVTNAGTNTINTLDASTFNYFIINSMNDWIALMLTLGLIRPLFKRKSFHESALNKAA